MTYRIEKINDLVRDNLSRIITEELSLKTDALVSITKVDTSKDLRYAQVLVSVFPEDQRDYAEKTLKKELYRIQGLLNDSMHLKIVPKINFILDLTQQKASELEEVFEEIRKEKKEKKFSTRRAS
ncbi:MAG: 30S ribosome-binding factor RbfA [Patescibacteria group bacterium]|nr:30S ribosome-binding factor RbfA [Patescibacteria group bacterium]